MLLSGMRLIVGPLARDGDYHGVNLARAEGEGKPKALLLARRLQNVKHGNMTESHFSFLAVAVKLPSKIGQKPPLCRSMRTFAVRHVGQFFEERLTGFLR
jgi:hypothetical protein